MRRESKRKRYPEAVLVPAMLLGVSALSACGGGGGGGSAPAPAITVSVATASVTEGDSGQVSLAFPVTLSASSAQMVQVDYTTSDQSAVAGSDYEAASGSLSFMPGVTRLDVVVAVFGDALAEGDETLTVQLSRPVNAVLGRGSVSGTILDDDIVSDQFGLEDRPSNPTCVAPPRGAAGTDILLVDAYPDLTAFAQPTKILQAPGDDSHWYVLEKDGRVRVVENRADVLRAELWMDISARVNSISEGGLLGMAFHPDWPAVAEVYLSYTGDPGGPMVSYVSRLRITDEQSRPVGAIEEILLTIDQDFNNHNGGDIGFGPERAMYVGLGDGGGGGDPNGRAQDTTRLLGSFLRVDVLGVSWPAPGYRIPADNPFSGNPQCGRGANADACPEIFAWGFRNPWRWSFDRDTGRLWAADVGQNQWEEVDVVALGGNFGWDCREGAHDFEPFNCVAGDLIEPVSEYDRSIGNSITGGYVYRGAAIPGLAGRYLFGDFGSGSLLSLAADGQGGYQQEVLLETGLGIVAFGEDQARELYVLDFGGRIRRIEPSGGGSGDDVPDALADTGCVDPADPTVPASGLIPDDINASFWSDGADKRRWMGLPDGATVAIDAEDDWIFPLGTVLMKDFALAGRLVETRLLMLHPDGVWAGYTYEWNESQTAATRVRGGKVRDVDGQSWIYPSEAECLRCHTDVAGVSLGPETAQLNRDFRYPSTGITADQLATLDHIGVFDTPLGDTAALPALSDPFDADAPLPDRARAYLHANCSQCHRPGGPTPASIDLRYDTPLGSTGTCDVSPSRGDLGITDARLVAPGAPARSVLLERMSRRDAVGMPPLGSSVVDTAGAGLISAWIEGLATCD